MVRKITGSVKSELYYINNQRTTKERFEKTIKLIKTIDNRDYNSYTRDNGDYITENTIYTTLKGN